MITDVPNLNLIYIAAGKPVGEDENTTRLIEVAPGGDPVDTFKEHLGIDADDDYSCEMMMELDSMESLRSALASRLVYPECQPLNETDRSAQEKEAPANLEQLRLITGRMIGWDSDITILVQDDAPECASTLFNRYLEALNDNEPGEPTAISDTPFMTEYSVRLRENTRQPSVDDSLSPGF